MLRWSVSLAALLGLVAVAVSGVFWSTSTTAERLENVRRVRTQHQQLEQQLALLQSPDITPVIKTLQEDLDALRIKLVEVVTKQPLPAGVSKVGYEQTMMPQVMDAGGGEAVNVLRLELTLTVLHSRGLLDILDNIDRAVGAWPHETRACELQRLPQQILSAQCVVDFYHWSNHRKLEAVQSERLHPGVPAWT